MQRQIKAEQGHNRDKLAALPYPSLLLVLIRITPLIEKSPQLNYLFWQSLTHRAPSASLTAGNDNGRVRNEYIVFIKTKIYEKIKHQKKQIES